MHDVGVAEVDDRVAVGVGGLRMVDIDLLAVEVEGDAVACRSATGSAAAAGALVCGAAIRLRMFSWEMITAPSLAIASLPPV